MPKFLKDSIKQLGMNDLASKDPVVSASESHRKDNSINNGEKGETRDRTAKNDPSVDSDEEKDNSITGNNSGSIWDEGLTVETDEAIYTSEIENVLGIVHPNATEPINNHD